MNFKQKLARVSTLAAVALAPVLSHAAAIDVDDVVTDIAAQAAPIGLVGGAVLLIFGAIKAFKWVRRAM